MTKGWYGKSMEHGLASRGIKSRMKVGFSNLGGLLGESPSSINEILHIRNRMIEAKERDDIDAMHIELMKIVPYIEDEDSNIEYIYNDNSMFYHPDSEEEFKRLYEQLFYFRKIGDTHGLYITALQILPDKIKEAGSDEEVSFFFGEVKNMAKGWHGKSKEHSLASKGVRTKNGTKLVWSDVETLRKGYEAQPTGSLIKMAENLDGVIRRNRTHPKGLNAEKKEEYIDNVNKFQAMTLELDRRGVEL